MMIASTLGDPRCARYAQGQKETFKVVFRYCVTCRGFGHASCSEHIFDECDKRCALIASTRRDELLIVCWRAGFRSSTGTVSASCSSRRTARASRGSRAFRAATSQ